MGWFSRHRFTCHRSMFLIYRLSLLLLLALPAFLPNIALAGTFTPPIKFFTTSTYGGQEVGSKDLICTTIMQQVQMQQYPSGSPTFVSVQDCGQQTSVGTNAQSTWNPVLAFYKRSDGGFSTTVTGGHRMQTCPAGTTRSGTIPNQTCTDTCVLPEIFNQTTGSCAPPPPPPCEAGCTGACGSYYSVNSTAVIAKLCISGCKYLTGDGVSTAFSTGSTTWQVQEKTGETCTSSNEPPTEPAPPSCPECDCIKAGKSYGTVNGTVVCTTLGTAGTAPAIVKSTSSSSSSGTSTDASGTPTTSSEDTQQDTIRVYNGDGTVSTTSEASTTNSDGSTTTKTEAKTQSTDDFCAENPTSTACKQQSLCEDNPDIPACKSFCEEYPTSVTCANFESFWDEASSLPEDGGIINTVKEMTFDLVEITGSNSCPPPVVLSFGGHSVSVSYNWLCEYAESFRPVVIAFAYLAAITIVFGAFRKGDF